jgi:hypothetical protein
MTTTIRAKTVDYVSYALHATRAQFVQAFPYFFLVGGEQLEPPKPKSATDFDLMTRRITRPMDMPKDQPPEPAEDANHGIYAFAVLKVVEAFESMITVGRTKTNDIVLPDNSVSKVHAFFKLDGEKLEIADAGSRNGTWVNKEKLVSKGPGVAIESGKHVKFGRIEFELLEAGPCWDRLQRELK